MKPRSSKLISSTVSTQATPPRSTPLASLAIGAFAILLLSPASRGETAYVSNARSNTVVQFTPSGVDSVFASTGFGQPTGLAFDAAGNLYVASLLDGTITKIRTNGVGSLFANESLYAPMGLAFDGAGNLYAANYGNITPGGFASVFASSFLHFPTGLAFDAAGNLYVANVNNNTVAKFTAGGVGSVFANTNLNGPWGLAFDTAGNLYVANSNDGTITRFTTNGVGSVFANSGLVSPLGLAFDRDGNLYAVDNALDTVRKFTPAGVGSVFANTGLGQPQFIVFPPSPPPLAIRKQPVSVVSCLGGSAAFSVSATGLEPLSYHWYFGTNSLNGLTGSEITVTNLQTTNAGSYSVIVSNSLGTLNSSNAQLVVNDACVDIHMYAGLNISGLQGATYVLKFSTNLADTNFANWTPLATNTMTGSNWFYLDMDSPFSPVRFYGVKLAP